MVRERLPRMAMRTPNRPIARLHRPARPLDCNWATPPLSQGSATPLSRGQRKKNPIIEKRQIFLRVLAHSVPSGTSNHIHHGEASFAATLKPRTNLQCPASFDDVGPQGAHQRFPGHPPKGFTDSNGPNVAAFFCEWDEPCGKSGVRQGRATLLPGVS